MTLQAEDILPRLESRRGAARWWVGLSGGLDSSVLLRLLVELRERQTMPPLGAIHVNHQLHPDSARWEEHCAALCADLQVEFECRRVDVTDTGEGPEASARAARYAVFEALLAPGELLLLAHHLDDQVETFFLRLMRGAGARGLAGMPESRSLGAGALARPLLSVARSELEAYARGCGLDWIEDSSNRDLALDRNFLRHRLLPLFEERWSGYRQSVLRSVNALAEAERALGELDGDRIERSLGEDFGEPLLQLAVLAPESAGELARLLRRWLDAEGAESLPQARLLEFSRQLMQAQEDSLPQLEGNGYCLRYYRGGIFLGAERFPAPPEELRLEPGAVVELPGLGRLEAVAATEGLRLPDDGGWTLRFRQGGERCRPLGRGRSQSLKKLLQEYRVPPWLREQLPLLYDGAELAGVGNLWVCHGHQAAAPEPAFRLLWTRNPPPAD